MVGRKAEKISALVYVTLALILCFSCIPASLVGIYRNAPYWHHFTYILFHAGIFHWLANSLCFLAIVFIYETKWPMILSSFAIAITFPIDSLSFLYADPLIPTIGMSGVCYALLGRYSMRAEKIWRYHGYIAVFLALSFIFPQSNFWLHLYCYLLGTVVSFITTPLCRMKV